MRRARPLLGEKNTLKGKSIGLDLRAIGKKVQAVENRDMSALSRAVPHSKRQNRHFSIPISYAVLYPLRTYPPRCSTFSRCSIEATFAVTSRRFTVKARESSSRARSKWIAAWAREWQRGRKLGFRHLSGQRQVSVILMNAARGSTCLYTFNEAYVNKSW